MNNRGQTILFGFMIMLTLIILALNLAGPLRESISEARNSNNLDCGNESISNYDKGACVVSDLTLFNFIGVMIFMAGAVMAARFLT